MNKNIIIINFIYLNLNLSFKKIIKEKKDYNSIQNSKLKKNVFKNYNVDKKECKNKNKNVNKKMIKLK